MFGIYLNFIIVLILLSIYQPLEEKYFNIIETSVLFFLLIAVFMLITWMKFSRLNKRIVKNRFSSPDDKVTSLLTKMSLMAIVFIGVDIFVLNLTSYLTGFRLFILIPTFQSLVVIAVFIIYLSIIWGFAYDAYEKLYLKSISKSSYIFSNIAFIFPLLLPWFFLSAITDIIYILPFDISKNFLATTEGEILYFFFILLTVAMIGPAMVQKCWGCHPLEKGSQRDRIEQLCQIAGVKYNNILNWPIFGGSMITAGVLGVIKRFRYILVTDALLNYLEPDELDAVIVHEIGHIKHKHLMFYMFFVAGSLILSYVLFDLFLYFILYFESVYSFISIHGSQQSKSISFLFGGVVLLFFIIYFRFIFGFFMRNFERQADIFIYNIFSTAKPLISTFKKIAVYSRQSPDKPNWHHFSISQRICYLEKCESDQKWIKLHNHKLRKSIGIYFLGMFCIGTIAYSMHYGESKNVIDNYFSDMLIEKELKKNIDNPVFFSSLGDYYLHKKKYDKTIGAYEKFLTLNSNAPKVLNNLAWIYATCAEKKLRNPLRAVQLAEKAMELKSDAPYIMDTMAESYYAIGKFEDAVLLEKKALALTKKDKKYYEKQIERFLKAAKKSQK